MISLSCRKVHHAMVYSMSFRARSSSLYQNFRRLTTQLRLTQSEIQAQTQTQALDICGIMAFGLLRTSHTMIETNQRKALYFAARREKTGRRVKIKNQRGAR